MSENVATHLGTQRLKAFMSSNISANSFPLASLFSLFLSGIYLTMLEESGDSRGMRVVGRKVDSGRKV